MLELAASDATVARATPAAIGVIVRLALAGGLGLIAVIASIVISITTARNLVRQLERLRNAARDLADARFPDEVATALAKYGVEPSWLELEVTESVLLSDRLRTSRMLERLVDQGVRIAIDDFGVGYSSLGQLKTLPAKVLKIDRSFVSSMESDQSDAALVSSTIELAHRLGLQVIAEGVETPAHLARLRAAGCDIGQGHLLGRPRLQVSDCAFSCAGAARGPPLETPTIAGRSTRSPIA